LSFLVVESVKKGDYSCLGEYEIALYGDYDVQFMLDHYTDKYKGDIRKRQ
jgi:hypothetical protein